MDNGFTPDLITLIDDDDVEHQFEILDTLEYNDALYYALYPIFDDEQDTVEDSGEYYVMEVIEQDGEEQLAEIEDDDLIDTLAEIFEERFENLFDDEDEDDSLN